MADGVIQFPKPRRSMPPSAQESLSETARELERRRAELVRRVRMAAEDPKRKFDRDDEIRPAQMNDKLIAEAKRRKITQSIIHEAVSKKEGRKVHLERLRADHNVSPGDAKKQSGAENLVKKVQPYVNVLETLAELLDRSRDDVIWDAFHETAFSQAAVQSADDPAVELSWWLHEAVQGVIRAEQLVDYFKTARSVHALYHCVPGDFIDDRYALVGAEGYSDGAAATVSWNSPPFPDIDLLRVHRASFSGPLLVEQEAVASPACPTTDVARNVSPVPGNVVRKLGRTDVVDAEVLLYTDVRLVIGPIRRLDDLGPLLECRSFVQLKTRNQDRALTFPFSVAPLCKPDDEASELLDLVGSVAAHFDDGWHRVTGFGSKAWSGISECASDFGSTLDNGPWFPPLIGEGGFEFATYWHPVNATTTAQLMQLFAQRRGQVLFQVDGRYPRPTELGFVGCEDLETALHTGAIEDKLTKDCQRLKSKLDEHIHQHKAVRERETAALIKRWRDMGQRT